MFLTVSVLFFTRFAGLAAGSTTRSGPILVAALILGLGQLGWILLGLPYAGVALGLPAAAHWAGRALPAAG